MTSYTINQTLIDELSQIEDPKALIFEIFNRFKDRAVMGTSGQLTGVVMIDMAVAAGIQPRVFTIDTLRLFKETYDLFEKIEEKYNFQIERIRPDQSKIQKMIKENGEYLFFDSKQKQEYCCHLRKVEPNQKVLETVDVWLTGLRSDQSLTRAGLSRFQIIHHQKDRRPILKVAPLIAWSEKEVRDYCKQHQVPVHPLLDWKDEGWYYESLGCVICTTPIGPDEARRAGRWRWFNKEDDDKECGLHSVKEDEV